MSALSKIFSLALVLVLVGPAMVAAQPDGDEPAQIPVASPTCIDHRGSPPGSGSITLAEVGETREGQRILVETVSGTQAPDCGLGPIQPCDQVQDPDALVYVDTSFLCAKNSAGRADDLCNFSIFLEFASASQASKCDVPDVDAPDDVEVPDKCDVIKNTPYFCQDPGELPDKCSVVRTIPVVCQDPDDLPDKCTVTIPVVCQDPEDLPAPCDGAPNVPGCGGGIDTDPCNTVKVDACDDGVSTDPCSHVSLPTCGGEIDPDPCSHVEADACEDGVSTDPCSYVKTDACDGGVSTDPCSYINVNACDDGIDYCYVAPSACPIHIPDPGPGPWDCVNGIVHLKLPDRQSSQVNDNCQNVDLLNPCTFWPVGPICGDKPELCDFLKPQWETDKEQACGVGLPRDPCSLLNIKDEGGDLPCGVAGPDPCAFAPPPPEETVGEGQLPCDVGIPHPCGSVNESLLNQPGGDEDLPCGLSSPDPCDSAPEPPEEPLTKDTLPCGVGVPHPCSAVTEGAEIPEGPLPCSDDPCAEDPDCRHFDPCQTLSPVLSTAAGFNCGDPPPTCRDAMAAIGMVCPTEPCDLVQDQPYLIEDCTVKDPCDELDRGIAVPGGRWSPADCGTRVCGEGGMEDTTEEKEPTEVVGCLLPPICPLEKDIEDCMVGVAPPGAPTDPCVAVDLVHAVISGQVGVDLCGKASQVVSCDSVVPPLPPETPCVTYRLNGEERVMAPDMPAVFIQGEPELREETAEASAEAACAVGLASGCDTFGNEYDADNVVAVLWWIGAPVVTPNMDPHECQNGPCVDINGVAGTLLVIPGPAAPMGSLTASAQVHTVEMGFEVSSFQPSVMIGDARFHGRLLGYGSTETQVELQDPNTVDVELALLSPNINGPKAGFARFNEDKYVRMALGATVANQGFAGRVHYDSSAAIKDPTKGQTMGQGTQVVVDWTTAVSGPLEITVNDFVIDVQNAPQKILGADIGVINTPEEKFFGIHWPGEQGVAKVEVTTPYTSLLQFLDVPPSFDASFHLYDGPDPAYPDDPERDPWQFMVSRYSAAGDGTVPHTDVVVEFDEEVKIKATDVSPDLQIMFARVNPDPENAEELALLDSQPTGLLVAPDDGTESNALPEFILGARDSTAATITNAATRVEVTVGDSARVVVRDIVNAYVDTRAFVNLNRGFDGLDVSFGDDGSIYAQLTKPGSGDVWTLTLDASDVNLLGNLYLAGKDEKDLRILADARVANNMPQGVALKLKVSNQEVLSFTRIQSLDLDMDNSRNGWTKLHAYSNQGSFLLNFCPLIGCSGTGLIEADRVQEIIINGRMWNFWGTDVPDLTLKWRLAFTDAAFLKMRSDTLDGDVDPGVYLCPIDSTTLCKRTSASPQSFDKANFNFKGSWANTACGDFEYLFERTGETYDHCLITDVAIGTIAYDPSGSAGIDAADLALQEVSILANEAGASDEDMRPEVPTSAPSEA